MQFANTLLLECNRAERLFLQSRINMPRVSKTTKAVMKPTRFVMDMSSAMDLDLKPEDFVEYVIEHFKTKAGMTAPKVTVERSTVVIDSEYSFAKKYVKYLAKRYLHSNDASEMFRVLSTDKASYEMRLYAEAEEEAE
ncbi:ribosomal protein L22e [Kipferlia bialata]|uniref:Large ribosomal subunit protein eL22 n=1 Tax=Kipferlia bialata TaxID=797122 RepID=A0A9K3CP09_9EUKA|nr:ribosomal protein L22e [Kipferlia bialata]|eukprot:g439.t1